MKRLCLVMLIFMNLVSTRVWSQENSKADDRVVFNLAAEDWVTTKTAHVTLGIEASVSSNNAGSMRADLTKAVNDVAKADWRLTSFERKPDQTGLEHWSVVFDARLPENQLNGLVEEAKKISKAGMQMSIQNIDFTPTLEEKQVVLSAIRTQLYKNTNEQLALLNNAIPGRNFRIAAIDFTGDEPRALPAGIPRFATNSMALSASDASSSASVERSEKVIMIAHVVLATSPSVASNEKR